MDTDGDDNSGDEGQSGTGDTTNTTSAPVHGAVVQSQSIGVVNSVNFYGDSMKQLVGMSDIEYKDKLIASQEGHIASQQGEIALFKVLQERHQQDFRNLEAHVAKAQSVVSALLLIITWLQQDRQRASAEHARLSGKLDNVVNENEALRVELDALALYLSSVDVEFARAQVALNEVHVEEGLGQRLAHALRTRWFVYFPDEAEPDLLPRGSHTARFALTSRPDDETELLAYCRKMLDEIHAVQVEVQKALGEIANGLYKTDSATLQEPTPDDNAMFDTLLDAQRKLESTQRKVELAQRKLSEDTKSLAAKEKKHQLLLSRPETQVSPRHTGTNGLFPGVGLFFAGVLVREVLKIEAPSANERLVLIVLTAVLVGLPCLSLAKWAKSADRPAPATAGAVGVFCVVAGYFCWVVVLVPALVALSAVVVAKRTSGGFVLTLLAVAVFGIALPKVMWWSWSGFDWFSGLF